MAKFKVLIPLDGSRLAETSLAYISALRLMGELEVRLLSVVNEAEEYHALNDAESGQREFNLLGTYLREVAQDVHKHLGLTVESRVRYGKPAERIVEEAVEFRPDLLLISTHGRSGVSRWRLGSVADKVVRTATCNTLLIGPQAGEESKWLEADLNMPFGAVLVPLDGSELAETALPVTESIALAYGSDVHLVRAVSIPPLAMEGEEVFTPDILTSLQEAARHYLDSAAKRFPGGKLRKEVLLGSAAWALEDYIKQHGIDLVVMTTHGRGGMLRAALGSVTDRLLGGPAPVLVVRSVGSAAEASDASAAKVLA
jgi:nucleotide-binding universal stress UspA family protein